MFKSRCAQVASGCGAIAVGLVLTLVAIGDFERGLIGDIAPNSRVESAHAAFAPTRASEPFGYDAKLAPDGELWTKWRRVETQLRAEMDIIAQCRSRPEACRSSAARRFISIVDDARQYTGQDRVSAVNRAINLAIQYADDLDQHGVDDRWSAPLATLSAGRGDCEDYVIAKLVALREAGVADDDLRFVIVRDLKLKEFHATLAVRVDSRWLVLDNRWQRIVEDRALAHYTPLFAFRQGIGVMQFAETAAPRPARARFVVAQR